MTQARSAYYPTLYGSLTGVYAENNSRLGAGALNNPVIYDRFAEDFGGLRPWIVREWQWYAAKNTTSTDVIRTEGLYNWGAAPFGFNPDTRFTVAEVGPGFTSFDQQGPDAIDMPRRGGAYYEDSLRQALASGKKIMAIETWNELDEGTGILETREWGRQYIDLTRHYVDLFKASPP